MKDKQSYNSNTNLECVWKLNISVAPMQHHSCDNIGDVGFPTVIAVEHTWQSQVVINYNIILPRPKIS